MSGVDVLAVLGKCVKYTEMTARKYGGETLANHANEISETRAAVAELIEAVSPFAVLADQLDATKDTEAAHDDECAKFRMVVKDYRRLRAALSRVRGAE